MRTDASLSVKRSVKKLPIVGEYDPDSALVIEGLIDAFMPPGSSNGGGRLEVAAERAPAQGAFERARHRSMIKCQQARAPRCAKWLADHPHAVTA